MHHDARIVVALAAVFLAAIVPLALTGARNSSEQEAARITVRGVLPLIQAYAADEGSYANMTLEALARYDRGLLRDVRIPEAKRDSYCVIATFGSHSAHITGPGETVKDGPCPGN